ncbi:hypothetical protein LR48_Vigan08g039700 [Vigna angularis]|uniref:Uncharacterized protein n=1 Tax=Phaseolus angularis TaxID=3914 RepID=A0A0L9V3D0_PHAAN|nr:hypothetical protein LR48_Vigan08g039700 [Vigna angularis]
MKGDWFPNLVKVFYHNLKIVNGDIWSRVKGVNIHIDNDVWFQVVGLKAEGQFSHLPNSETNCWLKKKDVYKNWLRSPRRYTRERLYMYEGLKMEERKTAHLLAWVILPRRMMQDVMTTEDICLLHAIKNDIPTNWVEVLKDHMADAALSNSHYLSYVVLISKLLILQEAGALKKKKSYCIVSGSTYAMNDDRRSFVPETNFERYVVDQFRCLNEKVDQWERKYDEAQQRREDNTSDEDTMKTSNSE